MGLITWNTDVNAPCCPGEILSEDGQSVLVQTDWDYPSVASSFGWSLRNVQQPHAKRAIAWLQEIADDDLRAIGDHFALFEPWVRDAWNESLPCNHDETDGTVDCKQCGLTTSDFIAAARDWLDEHDGATANDPGYFRT